ncbi:hypothetical protein HN51_059077 [Arachis hypogaea]|uniref:DEK-C domain-containing protein n=1 Tax=Arachis hypogaea TaxID=3818 RepID=A0A444X460_ARAHY|nr:nucleolin isoform X2 [Arachis ipaensis]XP_025680776.1 nucleolin isoform X2 [Arachis hypogaea]QHN82461.1 uncharacterized protein DS421_20g696050 [Arachis hypogaea]RYQ84392.1 hypothetical protein Ahy_B10g103671 [Arachis hypogaea]
MGEATPETETPKNVVKAETPVIVETQIETAMLSRVPHFKEQADSLTFEGVRRLLEKDLGLEEFALDVHKRFIKQCLVKCLEGVGDDDSQKISGEAGVKGASTKEPIGSTDECQSKEDAKDRCPEDEEKMEDSPVLGLLKEKEKKGVKRETKEDKDNGGKVVPSETLIKKALRKRATYIRTNSEKVTMASLRRLLEEDLKLDKFALDAYKKFISQQLDEVLNSSEVSKPSSNAKKIVKKKGDTPVTKKLSSVEESSDASDNESDEEDVKPRKEMVKKAKKQSTTEPKKRSGSMEEKNLPSKKRAKPAKDASEDSSDAEGSRGDSEDQSRSSREKPTKKKEVSTPVYGKRVEHLKSVIKACGMSVPPSIYKKIKQAPENKRETQLIKELEEILSREGLSSDPSEKEIKEVRKKKERAKELEGIDLSNIVSSSRRRSVTSFAPPPPKPKIPVETNGNDAKSGDRDKDDEDDDDEEDEEDEEEEDSSDAEESQSDEFNEDEDDSD